MKVLSARKSKMITNLFLAAFTALHIVLGIGSAQDPNGDSLMCYINVIVGRPTPPVCINAALADGAVDIKGRSRKAGEIFGGACTKTPNQDSTWVVKTKNGNKSLRPKSDQTKCLTFNNNDPIVELTPCESDNIFQNNIFEKNPYDDPIPSYYLTNSATGVYVSYDQARHRIKGNDVDKEMQCDLWVWMSEIKKKAAPVRNTAFTFPVKGETNPLRAQYAAGFVDEMVNKTKHIREVYKKDEYKDCKGGPSSCFPIDYDVGKVKPTKATTVSLNLSIKAGGVGYENYLTKNLIPTGMFAIPGQDLTIEVDNFNTSKVAIVAHLYLHDIPGGLVRNEIRPSHVALRDGLLPGVNVIRNIYGGPLTLEVIGTDPDTPSINAKISNAVPMATFILGVTTEKDWPSELKKQPSWIIFQSEYTAGLDLKAPYLKASFAEVEAMVKQSDILMKNNFLMSGYDLDADAGTVHSIPKGRMWWTRDSTYQYMYAANPIVLGWFTNDQQMLLNWLKFDPWGIPHEYGHTFQTRCFSNLFGTEVTNNIYTVFQLAYFCNDGKFTGSCGNVETGHDLVGHLATVKSHLASGMTFPKMASVLDNTPDALYFWLQLLTHYGYTPHRNMQRRFRERLVDPKDTLCNGDDKDKYDAVYETWSEMVGEDLTKHFVTYGVPVSAAAKKRVAAKKYRKPSMDISNIVIVKDMPMTWNPTGDQPSFALPPYNTMTDMPDI